MARGSPTRTAVLAALSIALAWVSQTAAADGFRPVGATGSRDASSPSAPVAGYRIRFARLHDGATVWNDARELALELDLEPPLNSAGGHRIVIFLDGERRYGPTRDTRMVLQRIDRGTHRLWAGVVDAEGNLVAESPRITIHHKQHHLGTPR